MNQINKQLFKHSGLLFKPAGLILGILILSLLVSVNIPKISSLFENDAIDYGIWRERMDIHPEKEISSYNARSTSRAPYVCGWFTATPYVSFPAVLRLSFVNMI